MEGKGGERDKGEKSFKMLTFQGPKEEKQGIWGSYCEGQVIVERSKGRRGELNLSDMEAPPEGMKS